MRKSKVLVGLILLAFSLALAGCGSSGPDKAAGTGKKIYLNLGSTSASSSIYTFYVALADSIKKGTNGEIDVNVVETGAAKDNILRMKKGQIDLGMTEENTNYKAMKGLGEYANNPMPEIRGLFAYQIAPQPFMVSASSGVEKLSDLNGKKFMLGFRGSASEECAESVLNILGIKPDIFRGALEDGVNAVKDRKIIGLVKSGTILGRNKFGPDPSSIDINTTVPLKLVGLSPDEVKIVKEKLPGYPVTVVTAGSYFANQKEDKIVLSLVMGVSTNTKMSEEVAYRILKAIIEDKKSQEQAYPSVKPMDYVQDTFQYMNTPLHPGAVKYYQEKGHKVPDRLIPPEMKK